MVLIVSANARIRRGWSRSLEERFSVHEASDRAALEKSMASRKFSILLLDLALPQLNRVGNLLAIQGLSPSTKIILFTRTPDESEAIKALKAGAKGYCCKDIDPNLLTKVVDVARKGEIWVGRKVISRFLEELTSISERQRKEFPMTGGVNFDCLTPREHQIALLVGDGSSNKEIANQLKISERTVKAHLTAVFHKVGISDRLRLALFITNDQHNGHRIAETKTFSNVQSPKVSALKMK
jgi:two-component system nitrate/nitrite response regulator NarL